jgi:hypothetical protein
MQGAKFEVWQLSAEISRQCRSTALQETIRYSLLAIRCHFWLGFWSSIFCAFSGVMMSTPVSTIRGIFLPSRASFK